MRVRIPSIHPRPAVAAACLAVVAAAMAPAGVASARPTLLASVSDTLFAVAAASPDSIWTGGMWHDQSDSEQILTQRWNGTAWKLVPSPNPGGATADNELIGMATISPARAWLDGTYWNGTNWQTLIMHWNGAAWKKVPSPDPGGSSNRNILNGIAVTSRTDAWAVGYYDTPAISLPLILRWNGKAWKKVASPNPGGVHGSLLTAVTVVSPSSAWAAGEYFTASTERTLILHWNGKVWKKVASPTPGSHGCSLDAIAQGSAKQAWAVGTCSTGKTNQDRTLILHWNGKIWRHVASPNPGGAATDDELTAVVPVGPSGAWAVGFARSKTSSATVIERWNGKAWRTVASPNPGKGGELFAATALSPANIWAVGSYFTATASKNLILHWNGHVWRRVASPNL